MDYRTYLKYYRNPKQLNKILAEVINGIEQLHALGYVHRDLKPENIVINLNPYEVKLIDFDRTYLYIT